MCLRELPTQDSMKGGGFLSTHQMRQDLLFLQTPTTWLEDKVIGMSMVEDGELLDGPEDPADWPYKTVLEAIRGRLARCPIPSRAAIRRFDGQSRVLRVHPRKAEVERHAGSCGNRRRRWPGIQDAWPNRSIRTGQYPSSGR